MKAIPNNSFSILVDITAVYVKFKIDSYIIFPMIDGGYFHIKPTYTTVNEIKFDIPPLRGKIEEKGRAKIFVLPDDKIQELVHMDYDFIDNILNLGARLTKESEKLPIGIGISMKSKNKTEEVSKGISIDMKSENKEESEELPVEINMDLKEDTRIKIDVFYK